MSCLTYRKKAGVLFVVAAGSLMLAGCSMAEDYEMGQEIQMGPFTFEVKSASATVRYQEDMGRERIISVTLRVLKNESRPRIDFGDFLNDMVGVQWKMQLIADSNLTLVDSHGHKFLGGVGNQGGRPQARFEITSLYDTFENPFNVERIQRFNDAHLETQPSDYRLIIENPDRREGQPRAVRIQLR